MEQKDLEYSPPIDIKGLLPETGLAAVSLISRKMTILYGPLVNIKEFL